MEIERKKINIKILWPVLVAVLIIVGYFLYAGFFDNSTSGLTSDSNKYISQTKIGKYVDILNKENISFASSIDDKFFDGSKNFYIPISQSLNTGRKNPFLP